ncbi:MAG: CDP-4-dehydro-6-deoxy-D-glucose 3-dehydratase [Fluviibacter phosphoraccumulans EoVTN8]
MYKYPLATTSWNDDEINAIYEVVKSGQYSMGAKVKQFEVEFAKKFDVKFSVMVNSGSSANLLMVASLFYTKNSKLKLERGDEVIVPAVSWSTTYYPLMQYGLKLKFVDIDLETLNIDLDQLKNSITDKTRAIFAVNLLGNPNDFTKITEIIGDRNITLLEDNCESMGASHNGKFAGTFGVMGSFSTFFSHHISTMEGGVVVTDDEELYHIMLSLRAHGWTRNLPKFNLVTGTKSDDPFVESFKFVLPGYNLRPLEMEGAIGLKQLEKLDSIVKARRRNAEFFKSVMSNNKRFIIQREIGESSWFGFSLVIKDFKESRREIINDLETIGFECRPIVAGNFVKNDVVKLFDYTIFNELKNSDHIDNYGLFIGNHHYDISDAIYKLAEYSN